MAETAKAPDISIVVPFFNEESNIPELYARLKAVLAEMAPSTPRAPATPPAHAH